MGLGLPRWNETLVMADLPSSHLVSYRQPFTVLPKVILRNPLIYQGRLRWSSFFVLPVSYLLHIEVSIPLDLGKFTQHPLILPLMEDINEISPWRHMLVCLTKTTFILLYDPKQWKPNLLTYTQIRSPEAKALWSLKHHSKKQ